MGAGSQAASVGLNRSINLVFVLGVHLSGVCSLCGEFVFTRCGAPSSSWREQKKGHINTMPGQSPCGPSPYPKPALLPLSHS